MNRATLQTLRGLACLMLVAYHVIGATPEQGLRVAEGWMRALADGLAPVRMPLFGFLAGWVHARHGRQGGAMLHDKAQRLLWPMLTVGTAFAVVQTLVPGTQAEPIEWATLHLLPVAHFWFLSSLFLIFVALVWLEPIWARRPHRVALTAGVAVAVYLSGWGVPWLGIAGAVYLAPYFLLGYGLALTVDGPARWPAWSLGALVVAAALGLWAVLGESDRLTAPMLLSGALSCLALWRLAPSQRGLAWVGDHSYAIFLFHVFFTAGARIVLVRLGVEDHGVLFWAGLLLGVMGPVVLAHLIGRSAWASHLLLGEPRRAQRPGPQAVPPARGGPGA